MCVMYIYIGHNPGLTDSTGHCTEEREAKRATEIHFVSSRDGTGEGFLKFANGGGGASAE